MLLAKALAWACTLAMAGVLIFAFVAGDFQAEGRALLSMPWGIVSLVDLYAGFALFSAWIVFRERSGSRAAIWVVLTLVLGFFSAAIYTLIALYRSNGNWDRFFLGGRAGSAASSAGRLPR